MFIKLVLEILFFVDCVQYVLGVCDLVGLKSDLEIKALRALMAAISGYHMSVGCYRISRKSKLVKYILDIFNSLGTISRITLYVGANILNF